MHKLAGRLKALEARRGSDLQGLPDEVLHARLADLCGDLEGEGVLSCDWRGLIASDDFRGLERVLTCAV